MSLPAPRKLLALAASVLLLGGCTGRTVPKTVVVIVLDTVRADHTSLCGYGRPTTPFLDALATRGDAAVTCTAYAPGSWTLPSHASYFTGLSVPEHGLHIASGPGTVAVRRTATRINPLRPSTTTLADRFQTYGYTTALVSGNPVLKPATGLLRGFQTTSVARIWGRSYGEHLVDRLDSVLRQVPPQQGLFLFVNIADAHEPWSEIPGDVGWVPARPRMQLGGTPDRYERWARFVHHKMSPEERIGFLHWYTDAYDYGVYRADRTAEEVVQHVKAHRGIGELRLIIVSDHGEYLGDHDRLSHGGTTYDDVTRVPLIVVEPGKLPTFHGPVSGRVVYDLAQTGRLPKRPVLPASAAYASPERALRLGPPYGTQTWAAVWKGHTKLVWKGGKSWTIDLATDPGEEHPLPAPKGADAAALARWATLVEAGEHDDRSSQALSDQLKSLGYLE